MNARPVCWLRYCLRGGPFWKPSFRIEGATVEVTGVTLCDWHMKNEPDLPRTVLKMPGVSESLSKALAPYNLALPPPDVKIDVIWEEAITIEVVD